MYLIKYKVEGYPKEYTAGPYNNDEVASQYNDIKGYSGVYDCEMVPVINTNLTTTIKKKQIAEKN